MGYFNNRIIDNVAIVFMLLGSINFSIHFLVIKKKSLFPYFRDVETKTFIAFTLLVSVLVGVSLLLTGYYEKPSDYVENALFEVISVVTSTGFGVTDFSTWPLFLPVLLITITFVGGCGGSTAGGSVF